jgi:hypothetical protein
MHTTAMPYFEKSPQALLNFSFEVIPAYAPLKISAPRHLKKENHERKEIIENRSRPV